MVDELKRKESQLKESEEKFKLILENANDLITIINENFEHEYINEKAYFDLLGYKKEDIIGKTPLTPLHPDDVKQANKILRNGFKYGEGRSEMRVRHKDGHYKWLEHKGKSFIDTDGKRKTIIISRDITERKRTEKEIMDSEERHRSLINNLSDIILEGDSKGIISYVSPQCYDIIGYQPSEIIGMSAFNYIHPEDVSKIAEAMKKAFQTGETISTPKYRLLHKNGNTIFVSAKGKFIKTNGMERFIVAIRDISAQIKFEQKLKESESIYKLISENANDLILVVNENLKLEYVNKKPLLKIAGYSIDEVIGKRVLNFIHPDDQLKNLQKFQEAFKIDGRGAIEARIKHKEGYYINVEINGNLFYNEDGEPKALLITRDITKRKKAENIIIEEYNKIVELSQIKSDLIMQASHEFKTPLSSIYAASQLLLKNFKEQFDVKPLEFIEIIYRSSQKLRQLIENLLDLSKIESNKLNLNIQKENLVEIINDCYDDLKYWAGNKEIDIKIELPKEIILRIDRIRIEQVIINLLSNAIKFTHQKGNIYIRLKITSQFVDLIIKDTGIGLTKKEKSLLFKKFGRIKRVDKDKDVYLEGTGLGLYISKEIVEHHNGKILVESEGRNKGSTFTIRLPKLK
ncbi:MAG: PAS domain S-box protein [Promethearchaeota archaeon]